nr:alpha/beta hydrolase fold domain-containing protein [Nakamurella aerolata]
MPESELGRLLTRLADWLPEELERWLPGWLAGGGVPPAPAPPWVPAPDQPVADWQRDVAAVRAATDAWATHLTVAVRELAGQLLGDEQAVAARLLNGAAGSKPAAGGAARPPAITDAMVPRPGGAVPVRLVRPRAGAAGGAGGAGGAGDAMPAVVQVHGGGYWMGGGRIQRPVLEPGYQRLADAVGALVVDVQVRLVPEHPYPAPIDDVRAVLAWLRRHAELLSVDPERIALCGLSSGANTVTVAALLDAAGADAADAAGADGADAADAPASIAALALVVPSLDLTYYGPAHRDPEQRAARDAQLAAYLGDLPADDPLASPALAADVTGLPPTAMVLAEHDDVVGGGPLLAEKLAAQGVPAETLTVPGLHAVQLPTDQLRADEFLGEFLRRRFERP